MDPLPRWELNWDGLRADFPHVSGQGPLIRPSNELDHMTFQALRGFRDYLPPEAGRRTSLFATMRKTARLYGFEEIETPSVESLELFKVKSGEGIVEETFAFKDKGDRDVCLISENTPSLARLFSERSKSIPLPVKWMALPKLWRYEEPQSGRTREFTQLSLDIYGVPGREAEVELLSAAKGILDAIGLRDKYEFRIFDRRITEALGERLGVGDMGAFFRAMDRYRKASVTEFSSDLARAGVSQEGQQRLTDLISRSERREPAEAILQELSSWDLSEEGRHGIENLRGILGSADAAGLSGTLVLDLTLVRGLAYYTSTVFEAFGTAVATRAWFGGGRYDRLIELFGGGSVPACGLAMGDQTLEIILRELDQWTRQTTSVDVYVACASAELRGEARRLVQELRSRGVPTDHDLLERTLSGQLKDANRRTARMLVIVGTREMAEGKVTVRNMRTGQQQVVPVGEVPAAVTSPEDGPPVQTPE